MVLVTANVSGGTSPFSYSWSGSNINPVNAGTVNANPSVAGTYIYVVTVTDALLVALHPLGAVTVRL